MHPIDFALLRQLVPHYRDRPRNPMGSRQNINLTYLTMYADTILDRWQINTLLRKAHFLGQTCVESADFTTTVEDDGKGNPYDGKQYEGRSDLGNTMPGDGARFIGRGLIQITGRGNYARSTRDVNNYDLLHRPIQADNSPNLNPLCLSNGIDLVNHPEQASAFPAALDTACSFWRTRNINSWADRDDVMRVTYLANGGLNALAGRGAYTTKAKDLLERPSLQEISDSFARTFRQ